MSDAKSLLERKCLIVSAPSGTGKTTLNRRLCDSLPKTSIAISHTTRPRREGEKDGVHYHFVSVPEFKKMIDKGEMLECAQVFGNYYGTSQESLVQECQTQERVILEIDVQGFKNIIKKGLSLRSIFIFPPNMQVLWERLKSRGTDSLEIRKKRFIAAEEEIESAKDYDYFVVNDNIDTAFAQMKAIACKNALENASETGQDANALSKKQGLAHRDRLIKEYEDGIWEGADEIDS